jgi:hypothetical protein
MTTFARRSRFEDYDRWREYHQHPASEAARQAAGWYEKAIFRSAEDPNEVVILAEVDDLERALIYLDSEEVKQRQKASGFIEMTVYMPT